MDVSTYYKKYYGKIGDFELEKTKPIRQERVSGQV